MRLTPKKIEEIIVGILGESGIPLIKELIGKSNISEFDLATKTKYDIKVVRRMLYVLHNNNLVGFTRKKDKQKGWYIYYWTLIPENVRFSYVKTKREQLDRLKQRLEEETKELFFVCGDNCTRLNFDQAISFDFHCPECGKLISQDSSEQKVAELKQKIVRVEEEVAQAQEKKKEIKQKAKERKKVVRMKSKKVKRKKSKGKVTQKKYIKKKK